MELGSICISKMAYFQNWYFCSLITIWITYAYEANIVKKDFPIGKNKLHESLTHHQKVQLLGVLDRLPKGTRPWKEWDSPGVQINHCYSRVMPFSYALSHRKLFITISNSAMINHVFIYFSAVQINDVSYIQSVFRIKTLRRNRKAKPEGETNES